MTEKLDQDDLLLKDEEIRMKLYDIQPDGFIWDNPTAPEMIKFRAIAKAQLAKVQMEQLT